MIKVFKKTHDDWGGSYKIEGDTTLLVEVGLFPLYRAGTKIQDAWRVSVWGNDDLGYIRDFDTKQYDEANSIFQQFLNQEYIDIEFVEQRGFKRF